MNSHWWTNMPRIKIEKITDEALDTSRYWKFSIKHCTYKPLPSLWSDRAFFCCWYFQKLAPPQPSSKKAYQLEGYVALNKPLNFADMKNNYCPYATWTISSNLASNYEDIISHSQSKQFGSPPSQPSSTPPLNIAIQCLMSSKPESLENCIKTLRQRWTSTYSTK